MLHKYKKNILRFFLFFATLLTFFCFSNVFTEKIRWKNKKR